MAVSIAFQLYEPFAGASVAQLVRIAMPSTLDMARNVSSTAVLSPASISANPLAGAVSPAVGGADGDVVVEDDPPPQAVKFISAAMVNAVTATILVAIIVASFCAR